MQCLFIIHLFKLGLVKYWLKPRLNLVYIILRNAFR